MEINIRLTSETTPAQLLAVAALVDVLAGRVAPTIATAVMPELRTAEVPNAPTTSIAVSGTDTAPAITAPTPDAGAPDRDSAGMPWDARIHSESKATVADGTWRKRRNVDEAIVAAVTAELRGAGDPTPSPSTDDTPPPPVEPVVTATAAVVADNASDEDDTPPPPTSDLTTWPKFVQAVQSKPGVPETAKTYEKLNELSATFGASKFLEMKDKPGQWAMFYDMVG